MKQVLRPCTMRSACNCASLLLGRDGQTDCQQGRVLGTQRHREHSWRRSHVLLPVLMYKWIWGDYTKLDKIKIPEMSWRKFSKQSIISSFNERVRFCFMEVDFYYLAQARLPLSFCFWECWDYRLWNDIIPNLKPFLIHRVSTGYINTLQCSHMPSWPTQNEPNVFLYTFCLILIGYFFLRQGVIHYIALAVLQLTT